MITKNTLYPWHHCGRLLAVVIGLLVALSPTSGSAASGVPTRPSRLRATITLTTPPVVQLAWRDMATNESRFELLRTANTATGSATKRTRIRRNTRSTQDVPGIGSFAYRLRACNRWGCSRYAAAVQISLTAPVSSPTPVSSPPPSPTSPPTEEIGAIPGTPNIPPPTSTPIPPPTPPSTLWSGAFCHEITYRPHPTASAATFSVARSDTGGPVPCGQFRLGDPWVATSDGLTSFSIVVSSITPNFTTVGSGESRHGYTLDPLFDTNYFDSRLGGTFIAPPPLPLTIPRVSAVQSLVKVVSDVPNQLGNCVRNYQGTAWGTCVDVVAILTILSTPENQTNNLRPHPYRNSTAARRPQPVNSSWDMLPPLADPPAGLLSVADVVAAMPCSGGLWYNGVDSGNSSYVPGACSRWLGTPQLSTGYTPYTPFARAFIRMLHADAAPYRARILHSLFQYSIDAWAGINAGWRPKISGGHHRGFKYLILLTGGFLNIPEMFSVGFSHTVGPQGDRFFSDDGYAYHTSDLYLGRPVAVFGARVPECTAEAYSDHIRSHLHDCGQKSCAAQLTPWLAQHFPYFLAEPPTVVAYDGSGRGDPATIPAPQVCPDAIVPGAPKRSLRAQYLGSLSSPPIPVDPDGPYEGYWEFDVPYAAMIWKFGLESVYNYDPVLEYLTRRVFCAPWARPIEPAYVDWFVRTQIDPAALPECPTW